MVDAFGVKSYRYFFDRQNVLNRLEKKERSVLGRTGAVGLREIRKRVRPKPTRKRKNRSKYPYWHRNPEGGLRHVLYVYEPSRGSVVVGPQKFTSARNYRQKSRTVEIRNRKPVPELLNEGGTSTHTYTYKSGSQYTRTKRYKSFPFVTEAFAPTWRAFRRNVERVKL